MPKKYKLFKVLAFVFTASISSVNFANDSIPPSIPDLNEGSDLATEFSNWSMDLQSFFSNRSKGITVVYGIGAMDTVDKNSSRYVESINAAYKQALLNAYLNLASATNPSGLDVQSSDSISNSSSSGDALLDAITEECKLEASKAYDIYLQEVKNEKIAKESLSGSIASRIRGEVPSTNEESNVTEPDFIYSCSKEGPSFEQYSSQTQTISDVLSGGRVWASVLHKNQLGIILMRTPDSSEIAKVLQSQLEPAKVLKTAFDEVKNRVDDELSIYENNIPYGMVGTRMMRLSNSEWALYAFGASQVASSASSSVFMNSISQDTSRQQSIAEAQTELARFSSLSLDYSNQSKDIRNIKVVYSIEVNTTQNTFTRKIDQEQTFGKIIEKSYSASSQLTLRGSSTLKTKLIKDDSLDYYLSIVAWSPSIMASQLSDRAVQESSGSEAIRSGRYNSEKTSETSEDTSSQKSKIIIPSQDW